MKARGLAVALAIALGGSGCFSRTRIYSRPSGAAVVIDNTHSLGRTPVELEEQVWLWTSHSITVRQDGYQPQTIQIRNTGINFGYVAACVCTLGLMLPIAFASEYPKQYVVDLAPSTPEASNEAVREGATVSFR